MTTRIGIEYLIFKELEEIKKKNKESSINSTQARKKNGRKGRRKDRTKERNSI